MIRLSLNNRFIRIDGASRATIRAIEAITSYQVEGFVFSPAYRAKRWDGKEHLLRYSTKRGYHAPVGLAIDICRLLLKRNEQYRVVFETHLRHKRRRLAWNPEITMRDYQRAAVKKLLGKPVPGSGVLKMPIRSGKTLTAAWLVYKIGRPTLFIAPSQMLLYQTIKVLRRALPGCGIGVVGDSEYSPDYITVATIQTLARMRGVRGKRKPDPRYKELMARFDLVVFDECHHIRGESGWHNVMADADARFKIGLSATAFPDNQREVERGIIWMKAVCGPIRVDISASELVEDGYLMKQNVCMYPITEPNKRGSKWSKRLRDECIVFNPVRNAMIARLAQKCSRKMKVLIIARFHDHIAAICDAMDDLDLSYRTITGRDSPEGRDELVEGLVDGEYNILIGTVLREGVDIPSVDCVINAEGGSDIKAAIQRQRNLTVAEGKRRALFLDFWDETNAHFRRHSKARMEAYSSEPAFSVRIVGKEKLARRVRSR